MIVKLFRCTTPDATRDMFHVEQQVRWRALRDVDGFVAQVGGVDRTNPNRVTILGFWRDSDAYARFMGDAHDRIFLSGDQGETYTESDTYIAELVLDMPGESGSFAEMVRSASLVRLADCVVAPGRIDHFVRAQRDIWSPGMAQASGMLGGVFLRAVDEDSRFLVVTFWSSGDAHDRYVRDRLPELRASARPDRDLISISGVDLMLEQGWTVLGGTGGA